MAVTIKTLDASYLTTVDNLGRPFRSTLGFLPEEALLKILNKGWVYGALSPEGHLLGYLIFARYPSLFRVTQLCVGKLHRGNGIARSLIEALKSSATTQSIIKLRCRRDFAAHNMWGNLGFIPVEESPGRSAAGLPLTLWSCRIAPDDELGLWRADTADETLDVVIDAQIFFDFDGPETPSSLISKGLLSDFLVDSLNFWITDELFHEIDRNQDAKGRRRSIDRAHGFHRIEYLPDKFNQFKFDLQSILPYRTVNEKSDIHHLAKTASSPISIFVTKDEKVLRRADEIRNLCGLEVLHPVTLITSLYDEAQQISVSPSRVSGLRLCWHPARKPEIEKLCEQVFKDGQVTKAKLREKLLSFSANPEKYRIEQLCSEQRPVAYRVVDRSKSGIFSLPMIDVARSTNDELYGSFLIADSLAAAIEEDCSIVEFSINGTPDHLAAVLSSMGFIRGADSYQRLAIAHAGNSRPSLEAFDGLSKHTVDALESMADSEFERACAPLTFQKQQPCFLIPIKPSFAMGLIDRHQSASDLFGGDPTVLLRWENVYYRSKNRYHMLKAPGRILWYVSGSIKEVVAISHLDEVTCDLPKALFKKYRKFGVLEWRDVFELCNKDVEKEIMALKFSLTFAFRRRVALPKLRSILEQQGVSFSLQGPFVLPHSALLKIFEAGYGRS